MPKDKIELALKLEADRIANLLLDEKEFRKERAVVMEERRLRTEDVPQSLFLSALWQLLPLSSLSATSNWLDA